MSWQNDNDIFGAAIGFFKADFSTVTIGNGKREIFISLMFFPNLCACILGFGMARTLLSMRASISPDHIHFGKHLGPVFAELRAGP